MATKRKVVKKVVRKAKAMEHPKPRHHPREEREEKVQPKPAPVKAAPVPDAPTPPQPVQPPKPVPAAPVPSSPAPQPGPPTVTQQPGGNYDRSPDRGPGLGGESTYGEPLFNPGNMDRNK